VGSSTFRSLAKPTPSRALGIPSNSATKNDPSTFYLLEPLLLIPLGSDSPPGNQEGRAAGESPYSFSTEPLFLIPSRRDRRPGSQEIRLGGMHCTFYRGNQFSSFLPARTAALEAKRSGSPGCSGLFFKGTSFPRSFRLGPQPWKPGDRARRDALHLFSREPLFLIPFVSRTPLVAPDFLQQFFL
jgi:hypothetical protein